jgi:outer membrane protein insertion porin family
MRTYLILLAFFFLTAAGSSRAQAVLGGDNNIDYLNPREYEIGGVTIAGTKYLDESVLISLSGLSVGQKIQVPGERITKAIESLWKQGLFSDVKIVATKVQGEVIFLEIALQERPRLSRFSFKGVSKSDADKLREKIQLVQGKVITENIIRTTSNIIREYYADKGFLDATVNITEKKDSTLVNSETLLIQVDKKKKIKINRIEFEGNTALTDVQLRRTMKETKEKRLFRIFSSSKYLEENFEKDKAAIIAKYNTQGYRDVKIVKDSIYRHDSKTLNIKVTVFEGKKFYFRHINWVGNSKYSSKELDAILGIKKGDIFDQSVIDSRINMDANGRDIRSLYMDNGYLFFQIEPLEVAVTSDSIDLEIRISEGKQATINKVTVTGNTKTNDKVIMREVKTKPGQLFSKLDIIRSQRDLAQLGYFDPEKMNVIPKPNPAEGTVDINYVVEEKPSDQVELSGGYGAGRIVGTLGLTFSNFSARNFFNAQAWRPLPSGDGQRLSLRVQSNGIFYQSYNASFVEPWLGGKKPNSLSVSAFRSVLTNGLTQDNPRRESTYITGGSIGLGKRLQWPDDWFTMFHELAFQRYTIQNSTSTFLFSNGYSNNLNFVETIQRNSIDQPIFPRTGSQFSLTLALTPPYSLLNGRDYTDATPQEKYKWIEYHKWKFNASWFTRVIGDLVLNTRAKFGFLGFYNPSIGQSPFERFYLGGDGLTGFRLDGREIIALRGYENNTLTPRNSVGSFIGATVYNKYTFELRYPISLNPNATIYALTFAEAGNSWLNFSEFNPFESRRSVGAGLRVFLPMLGGLLGIDYGYGFDNIPGLPTANGGQFHFSIGASME